MSRLIGRAALTTMVLLLAGCDGATDPAASSADQPAAPTLGGATQQWHGPPDVLARRAGEPSITVPTVAAVPPTTSTTPPTPPETTTTLAEVPPTTAPPPPPEPEPAPPAPPNEQPQPTTTVDGSSPLGYLLGATNALRQGLGLPALQQNGPLLHSAGLQAELMAATNSLSHQDLSDELAQGWMLVGENVGYGPGAEAVFQALVNSPGHYANLVNAGYTHVGMATRWDSAGRLWVAQVFGG